MDGEARLYMPGWHILPKALINKSGGEKYFKELKGEYYVSTDKMAKRIC